MDQMLLQTAWTSRLPVPNPTDLLAKTIRAKKGFKLSRIGFVCAWVLLPLIGIGIRIETEGGGQSGNIIREST